MLLHVTCCCEGLSLKRECNMQYFLRSKTRKMIVSPAEASSYDFSLDIKINSRRQLKEYTGTFESNSIMPSWKICSGRSGGVQCSVRGCSLKRNLVQTMCIISTVFFEFWPLKLVETNAIAVPILEDVLKMILVMSKISVWPFEKLVRTMDGHMHMYDSWRWKTAGDFNFFCGSDLELVCKI